jgi:hypothetical protein
MEAKEPAEDYGGKLACEFHESGVSAGSGWDPEPVEALFEV